MADANFYQIPEMGRIRTIHFVGIGGAGMSGIAGGTSQSGLLGNRVGFERVD